MSAIDVFIGLGLCFILGFIAVAVLLIFIYRISSRYSQ